jgi:lysozyme
MNKPSRSAVAGLVLSASLLVSIAVHESYRGEAYIPVKGDVSTIGFGSTKDVKPGDKTTPERALVRLLADINSHSEGIKRCIKVPLYQHEFDAYSSLAFNIGVSAFCGSTLVKLLNAGNYAGACTQILRWNRFRGQVLSGLKKRREAEYRQCIGGES